MALAEPVKIFDSTTAADGKWIKVSNFPSWSLHLQNLEGTVWIEASNDPNVLIDGANGQLAAPAAPVLSQFAYTPTSGENGVTTSAVKSAAYSADIKIGYITKNGTTLPSVNTILAVLAGNLLQVASPAADAAGFAVGYNVYAKFGTVWMLQTPSFQGNQYNISEGGGVPIGQSWIANNGIINTGIAAPAVDTSGGPAIGVNISGNLGGLTFAATPTFGTAGGETQITYDTGNGNQLMLNPSCLVYAFLRVRKSATAQTKETLAYLLGQNA